MDTKASIESLQEAPARFSGPRMTYVFKVATPAALLDQLREYHLWQSRKLADEAAIIRTKGAADDRRLESNWHERQADFLANSKVEPA